MTSKPLLSICIPTFNRLKYLSECLDSIFSSLDYAKEENIEIIVSDNASTDGTKYLMDTYLSRYSVILYYRNDINIGAEANFYELVRLAKGEYIWVFGDDDKMTGETLSSLFPYLHQNYNLIISNFSKWTKDMKQLKYIRGINFKHDKVFLDHNLLIKTFGLHMGYISSIIFKKDIFTTVSYDKYLSYSQYGFSFLYAIYFGIMNKCNAFFVARPLFKSRMDNSGGFDWDKYFIEGSSIIFENLNDEGYNKKAIVSAKNVVLKDFVLKSSLSRRRKDKNYVFDYLRYKKYFHNNWLYWFIIIPVQYIPRFLIIFLWEAFFFLLRIRNYILLFLSNHK